MQGALLKLLVKDKLPHSREVPVNAKEWQLNPERFNIVLCREQNMLSQLPLFQQCSISRANMATLYTPTCSTCSERFPGSLSPKPNECLHFDLESCNLMCIYTVVTDPCHIPPLAQARPMMLCIYTSLL